MTERIGSLAFACHMCGELNARWRMTRQGDVVVRWACDDHFLMVCEDMRRAQDSPTKLVVHVPESEE